MKIEKMEGEREEEEEANTRVHVLVAGGGK
jgi:hypothetical protein